MLNINKDDLHRHHVATGMSDRFALACARGLVSMAGTLFGRRYGDRVVVIETIAAVPAMVAATLLHLQCLRRMIDDRGWVRTFMDEAENQRAHLMAFVAIARPSFGERLLIAVGQGLFFNAYFLLYLISPRTAHRMAGYLAEQSVRGYTLYLERIAAGAPENCAAPASAIAYWNLSPDARLDEMVTAMREDEAIHRDIHHMFADALAEGEVLPSRAARLI
ncbi:MAG TPA: alternative oxidase [Xanthobacteraceae bacterium]|nr:alternative oxidase [Xanthobacteraceae bacterium]